MVWSKDSVANPRLTIFASHPTPFDGPLYRKMAAKTCSELQVYYWRTDQPVHQGEGGVTPRWDNLVLTGGYEHFLLPAEPLPCWRTIWDQSLAPSDHRVILVNGWSARAATFALAAAYCRNIPIILRLDTVDLYHVSVLKALRRWTIRSLIYRLPVAFMGVGSLTRQHLLRRGIKGEAVFTFPYALDNDFLTETADRHRTIRAQLRASLGLDPEVCVIMAALKFVDREGAMDLLRAFTGLESWHRSTVLLLVGDGPMRPQIESFIRQYDAMRVIMPGWVPYSRLIELFAVSDLFVHPGIEEPWGCSVQEAAACRLPIIGSDLVGASHDLIEPGISGLVYQGGNVESLRQALIAMLGQREKWTVMGERSWDIVQNWGPDRCLSELEHAVDYAMSHARKPYRRVSKHQKA